MNKIRSFAISSLSNTIDGYDADGKKIASVPLREYKSSHTILEQLEASLPKGPEQEYMDEHQNPVTRICHFLGLAVLISLSAAGHYFAAFAIFLAFAFGSHIFVEGNWPTFTKHPRRIPQLLYYEQVMLFREVRKAWQNRKKPTPT